MRTPGRPPLVTNLHLLGRREEVRGEEDGWKEVEGMWVWVEKDVVVKIEVKTK